MSQPIIQVKNTTFSYDQTPVLHSISIDVPKGEFIGIIGPNGSGKSTLLKLLGGVLTAGSGNLLFNGTYY